MSAGRQWRYRALPFLVRFTSSSEQVQLWCPGILGQQPLLQGVDPRLVAGLVELRRSSMAAKGAQDLG